MRHKEKSPEEFINQVPKARQSTLKKLRKTIKENLPKGFEEGM